MIGPELSPEHNEDRYGFRWGPIVVARWASFDRGNGHTRVLGITSDRGPKVHVYVSPTGRSVRVYRDGKELT